MYGRRRVGKTFLIREYFENDLIKPYNNFGETRRNTYYRLSDPFCLFYLNFARKNPTGNPTFWQDNINSPKLNAWRGLAFEDVCFVHQKEIRAALGIAGVQAEIYPWHSEASGSTSGAQIDMLVDSVDRVINLCEMKFCQAEYTITKDYDAKMREKLDRLMLETGRKRNIQTVFVTTYGLKNNMYSGKVQRVITMDDLLGRCKEFAKNRRPDMSKPPIHVSFRTAKIWFSSINHDNYRLLRPFLLKYHWKGLILCSKLKISKKYDRQDKRHLYRQALLLESENQCD